MHAGRQVPKWGLARRRHPRYRRPSGLLILLIPKRSRTRTRTRMRTPVRSCQYGRGWRRRRQALARSAWTGGGCRGLPAIGAQTKTLQCAADATRTTSATIARFCFSGECVELWQMHLISALVHTLIKYVPPRTAACPTPVPTAQSAMRAGSLKWAPKDARRRRFVSINALSSLRGRLPAPSH